MMVLELVLSVVLYSNPIDLDNVVYQGVLGGVVLDLVCTDGFTF